MFVDGIIQFLHLCGLRVAERPRKRATIISPSGRNSVTRTGTPPMPPAKEEPCLRIQRF